MYTTSLVASIIGAKLFGLKNNSNEIAVLLTDSRQLTEPKTTLFFALNSDRNNAHQYIYKLIQQGVKNFVVKYIPKNCEVINGINFLVVNDPQAALQTLAAYHRGKFEIPVIAITGSNGKTIVKEWLYQLLKTKYNIVRSPKSFNSQIGVPLSAWQMNKSHTLALFECGISREGEMTNLEKIIRPTIGVFTFLGTAHDEGFNGPEKKLFEKLKLFSHCDQVIINAQSVPDSVKKSLPSTAFIISDARNANLQILKKTIGTNHTKIEGTFKNKTISIEIPFTDNASIDNAITCWATLLYLNISAEEIKESIWQLQPVAMRLELKQGVNNCVLINDCYNSDINSLEIALHHLAHQHRGGKKIVVLSDIEQSGKSASELYTKVAALLNHFNIDIFVGVGKAISTQRQLFSQTSFFYENTTAFVKELRNNSNLHFYNSIILLKGARSFGFEAIGRLLQQKSHDTVLEINLNYLVHNLNFYRAQIKEDTMVMCMVKATGYGSGSSEIAFTLQHQHVNYLAVAYADEGVELRAAGIHLPVMVMNPEEAAYDDIIDFKLEPELFSFKVINDFIEVLRARALTEVYPVHIKLDTGMHRLGFDEGDLPRLIATIKSEPLIKIQSVFSHLAASNDQNFDEFTNGQIMLFEKMTAVIEKEIGYTFIKHICNSGAITRFKDAHYNMVRLGIGMYGIGFNDFEKQNLKNISKLKTRISQIKKVVKGETVGYSRNGIVTRDMIIATIPVGYADGLNRKTGSGNFTVYINSKACKTVGNICMDMCMVDITEVDCKEGDEVVVFETFQQLMNLSKAMETIPYEVLTGISSRVKRVYVQE